MRGRGKHYIFTGGILDSIELFGWEGSGNVAQKCH